MVEHLLDPAVVHHVVFQVFSVEFAGYYKVPEAFGNRCNEKCCNHKERNLGHNRNGKAHESEDYEYGCKQQKNQFLHPDDYNKWTRNGQLVTIRTVV